MDSTPNETDTEFYSNPQITITSNYYSNEGDAVKSGKVRNEIKDPLSKEEESMSRVLRRIEKRKKEKIDGGRGAGSG